MPDPTESLARLNQQFARPNIASIDAALFAGSHDDDDIAHIAAELGLAPNQDENTILTGLPKEMLEALLAFIHQDLSQEEKVPITFAFAPASQWEMTFYYPGPCGHTVLMRGPSAEGISQS